MRRRCLPSTLYFLFLALLLVLFLLFFLSLLSNTPARFKCPRFSHFTTIIVIIIIIIVSIIIIIKPGHKPLLHREGLGLCRHVLKPQSLLCLMLLRWLVH